MEEVRVKEINLKNGDEREVEIEVKKSAKRKFSVTINGFEYLVEYIWNYRKVVQKILEMLEIQYLDYYNDESDNRVITFRGETVFTITNDEFKEIINLDVEDFLEQLLNDVEQALKRIKEIENEYSKTAKAILRVVL